MILVMPALVAGIHVLLFGFVKKDVDGRDKPGHDGVRGRLLLALGFRYSGNARA